MEDHALSLALLPLFLFPARRLGRRLQRIVREKYNLNAEMNTIMVERFNVAGALLVKLFGRPADEDTAFSDKAGRVREIGVIEAVSTRVLFVALSLTAALATALVYGWGGALTIRGALDVGTLVALAAYLGRLYGPLTALSNMHVDIMMALVSFERVFEVLDIKPMVTEKPSAVAIPRGPASIEFRHVAFTYPAAKQVSLASLESVALPNQAGSPQRGPLRRLFQSRAGAVGRPGGSFGRGQDHHQPVGPAPLRRRQGTVEISGVDVRDATFDSLRATVGVVTQDAHMFHDTIRHNLLYAKPDATRTNCVRPWRLRRYCPLSTTWRTVWTPSWGTAGTGSPAARSNVSLSPVCCSRHRMWWCWMKPPRTSTRSRRSLCRPLSRPPSKAGPLW